MKLNRWHWIALFVVSALVAFGLGTLVTGLAARRQDGPALRGTVTPISSVETDPAVWGLNFPLEYRSWLRRPEGPETKRPQPNPALYAGYSFAQDHDRRRSGYPPNLHPATCLDCHDPKTMALKISQRAFREGLAAQGLDPAKASEQDLRTYVCAQCHGTTTFTGEGSAPSLPWEGGLRFEQIYASLEKRGAKDWVHALSGAPMLKLRAPSFELWKEGLHAFRGVGCADCHMPYVSEGGTRISSHQIHSPRLEQSCVPCHRWTPTGLKDRVASIQGKTRELQVRAEQALLSAHQALGACTQRGIPEERLRDARRLLREGQARWDFVASEPSQGFHAPQEAMRLLGLAIDQAREAEIMSVKMLSDARKN